MHCQWKAIPALAVAAAFLVAGCGGDAGREWQGTVTDSAGIPIVVNPESGMWPEDAGWTVAQELVIGTAEGDPEYQFGQISGLDVGSDGAIYVMDQQARQVRVFSADGVYQATIGSPGSGPGELGQGAGPVFVAGDTVQVPDMMNQRVNLYTTDGEPAGSFPIRMTEGIPARWMEAPDDRLVQQAMIMQLPGQEDVEPRNLLLKRGVDGSVVDTLLEMPIGQTVSFAGGQASIRMFESEPMWTIGNDARVYSGVNSEYSLDVHGPDGSLERILRKEFERRPITESDQAEFRRVVEQLWQDQGVPPQAMEQLRQALGFADFYPAYANLLTGPEGTLWVQGVQTPDDIADAGGTFNIQDTGSARWEVFDAEGRLLGTVVMPQRFTPALFVDDDLYGILRDDLDVQYVARMRVDRGATTRG